MRIELWIVLMTLFFIVNTYYDNKYTKMLMGWKKYYKMIFIGILGLGIYLVIKKNPTQGKSLLLHANNVVKYMPIDRGAMDMLNPILDFTVGKEQFNSIRRGGFMEQYEEASEDAKVAWVGQGPKQGPDQAIRRPTKRCVSETKKKFVASSQNWQCGDCGEQLNHTYEVDHKVRLEYGGTNEVNNLVALCRNCHGKKTALENM